jgi:hypothetical protein
MASEFPECEFLGIDISPLQPTTVLPQNCSFELANVLEGLYRKYRLCQYSLLIIPILGIPRPDGWFDYVHQRLLVGAIPANKWKQHIQECARVCTSGGWVEIIESNGQSINGGPACQQLNIWLAKASKTLGIDASMVQHLDELMYEAGLINITKHIFTVPFGPWGGKAGELFAENAKLGINAVQPLITGTLGVPKEEVERKGALMMEEFQSHKAYSHIYVYLGQKQ